MSVPRVTDRAGALTGDLGFVLDHGGEDVHDIALEVFVVEVVEDQFVVAVEAAEKRLLEPLGEDVISEGFLIVVDRLVLQFDVVDEIAGGGFEDESVFFGPVRSESFVDAGRISDSDSSRGSWPVQALPTRW